MSWGSRLKDLRSRLTDDPDVVRAEIVRHLGQDGEGWPRPTDRVRLHSLLVASYRDAGDVTASLQALDAGLRIGGSSVAQAELLVVGAGLHVLRRDAAAALELISGALGLVEKELSRPQGRSYSAVKRRQWLVDIEASCWIVRSEVALGLEEKAPKALASVLEAMALTSERSDLRVRMSAVSQLSAVLLRFGSLSDVQRALWLVNEADRELARRRFRRSHLHRVLLRWARAVALARLGSVDRAENIMVDVIEHLRQKGQAERVQHAVDALAWIVGERAGRPDRATYLRRKYAS